MVTEADWKYTRRELDEARHTTDVERLEELSRHKSKFVRAQVAGNPHSNIVLRQILALDSSRGVILWLIGNPSLTKSEFDDIFTCSRKQGYCDVVTPTLAGSLFSDIYQLTQLTHERFWNMQIAILNNHIGRGDEYFKLIQQYLAHPDSKYKDWTEVEKLAYYRINNSRLPPQDED